MLRTRLCSPWRRASCQQRSRRSSRPSKGHLQALLKSASLPRNKEQELKTKGSPWLPFVLVPALVVQLYSAVRLGGSFNRHSGNILWGPQFCLGSRKPVELLIDADSSAQTET